LGSSPGAITAAYGIFSFPDSFPHPVGGQPGNLLPVHTPGSWICRPRGSAILAGIRQQVLYSSYPPARWISHWFPSAVRRQRRCGQGFPGGRSGKIWSYVTMFPSCCM
jgi:hypothetical protein